MFRGRDDLVVCPQCGTRLRVEVHAAGRGNGLLQRAGRRVKRWQMARPAAMSQELGIAAAPAVDTWEEVQLERPSRSPTVGADVIVPFLQAAVSGGVAWVFLNTLARRYMWPAMVTPTGALLAVVAVWWWRILDLAHLLRDVERYIAPEVPEPPLPEQLDVTVHHKSPHNHRDDLVQPGDQQVMTSLPVNRELARALFRAVASGAHSWSVRGLGSVPGFSEDAAKVLLDSMMGAGFLRFRDGNPNHPEGRELTPAGRALGRRLGVEV